ncbi:MAG: DUF2809 domain-containing protein [Planctomycetes bacterium]|nr:DUF2809 domain-containing protein [Planctomycetota bacterium]
MATAIVVELPHGQAPELGSACVACGAPTERTVAVDGTWCFGVRRARCNAPMCAPCELARVQRQRLRAWTEILGLAAATIAATGLVPVFGRLTDEDVLLRIGLFLAVMLPFWSALTTVPFAFAVRPTPESVGYVFADRERARAFAAANGGAGAPILRRARTGVAGLLCSIVVAALLSRRYPLPGLLAEHTGDALYATAAFFLFALVRPSARTTRLGVLAGGFAIAVETTQLLDWPWLQAIRATGAGALLLGQGFQWADVFAYCLGAAAACVVDATFLRRSIQPVAKPDRLPRLPRAPGA